MRLLHTTDIHLDFIGTPIFGTYVKPNRRPFGSPREVGDFFRIDYPDCDAMVITGDLAQASVLQKCMTAFAAGWGKPIYFVLGNHDYYMSSFDTVNAGVARWATGNLTWLTGAGPIRVGNSTLLCGHEGWYDCRGADPYMSQVVMSDMKAIRDFRGMTTRGFIEACRQRGAQSAIDAEVILREACSSDGVTRVIFATHVPPFREAAWHEGSMSDQHWLPWMANLAMGSVLTSVAEDHPDVEITVLCGHTHSAGTFRPLDNLTVRTAASEYWWPTASDVLDTNWTKV